MGRFLEITCLIAASWKGGTAQVAPKLRAGQDCTTPMPGACSILSDVREACCSAGLAVPFDDARYCSACQGSRNQRIAQEIESTCMNASRAAAATDGPRRPHVHFGARLMFDLAREFRQALAARGSTAEVCSEE